MSRTYGETRDCRGCRFWSEMVAKSEGSSVVALCLANGPKKAAFTHSRMTCESWASGHLGAIDEPGSDGTEYNETTKAARAAGE